MKVSPVQGTGVPGAASPTLNQTATPSKLQRAKAIAMGQEVPRGTGDVQADRVQNSIKRLKMKTQVSTNRHEQPIEEIVHDGPSTGAEVSQPPLDSAPSIQQVPTSDPNEVKTAAETKPLDPQLVAIAKAKRALQIEKAKFEQEKAKLATNSQVNLDEYVSKADLKANPLKIFETGITYDQLTEAILANPNAGSSEIAALKAELASLRGDIDTKLSERDQLSEQQVLSQMKRDADLITAQGEQYEAIRQYKAQDDVVELIHRTWKQTGEVLDVSQAAELVENQLIEENLPFAQLKKVQSRLTPKEIAQEQAAIIAPKPNTKVMRTITNRDALNPATMDRRSRAIAAANGLLKRG